MIGIVLALLAAVANASTAVLVRRRLDESDVFSVTLVIVTTNNVLLWPFVLLFTNLEAVNFDGVVFFIIAGLLHPGIGRLLYFKGMEAVGASVNASIFATYPMYSSILAAFLLEEILSAVYWIGILCTLVGVLLIERGLSEQKTAPRNHLRRGLIFPFLGTLFVALSHVARKQGLIVYNEPSFGAAVGFSVALILLLFLSRVSDTVQFSSLMRRDFRTFWKAGVCSCLGWIFTVYAMSVEGVSIVTPLIQTSPLFVLFFAYLFLKESKYMPLRKILVSTLLIIVGATIVSVG